MDLYNERRPTPRRDGDDERPLDRDGIRAANSQIRSATPAYRLGEVNTKIRTAAVQRHRGRRAGLDDYSTVGQYVNFICGTDDGCE